jgi:phosphohistidine phosphatase
VLELLETLRKAGDEDAIVLVGHEPHLGKLAGTLLFGAPAHMPIKKAGACAIQFEGHPRSGAGRLAWFLPARALRQIKRRSQHAKA